MNRVVLMAAGALALALPPLGAQAQSSASVAPMLSKPFREAYALAASGDAAAIDAAGRLATLPDEKYLVAGARYNRAVRLNAKRDALLAIEAMLASQSSLLGNRADLIRTAGTLSFDLGDAKRSATYLTAAESVAQNYPQRALMAAEALARLKRYPEALAQFDRAAALASIGGAKPPESWYYRAISVARAANSTADQARLGTALIRTHPTVVNWRTVLMNYRDGARLNSDAQFDLARLLRASGGLTGERDYLEFADLAIERGAAAEAQAALGTGVSNQIVQASAPAAKAKIALAATRAKAARSKEDANAKRSTASAAKDVADSQLARGENLSAATNYRTALSRGGGNADEINTRLGIALTRAGQFAEARQAFGSVTGSRAEIARFWLLWLEGQG